MRQENIIKVTNGALEQRGDEYLLRGVIDPESLSKLQVDSYQREFLGGGSKKSTSLKRAVADGEVLPDVELGMRGENFESRGTSFSLQNDVYIIDGYQRIQTVLNWMADNPGERPKVKIGALIHLGTDRERERKLFAILNTRRSAVSANVILRNDREDHNSVLTLYGLSRNNKLSPLYNRVSWDQQMKRGELFTALMLCRVAATLHSTVGRKAVKRTGGGARGESRRAPDVLDAIAERVGLQQFRANTEKFFDVMDEAFGIKTVVYRQMATHTKTNFLVGWANIFANHKNFWRGHEFVAPAELRAKLKSFPVNEPTISKLAGSGNTTLPLLTRLMVDHLNKGKRTNRLEPKLVEANEPVEKQMRTA